jgi:hypothetical protein
MSAVVAVLLSLVAIALFCALVWRLDQHAKARQVGQPTAEEARISAQVEALKDKLTAQAEAEAKTVGGMTHEQIFNALNHRDSRDN